VIVHNVTQGSPEWLQARLGIPTASEFHRILTPGGKASTQSEAYMHRCLAEWVIGVPIEGEYESQWMIRGHELEEQAVKAYEFATDSETEIVGFVTNDAGTAGASPDRLVGKNGGLELKCPSPQVQVGYLLAKSVDEKYKPQVQGNLWLTERDWWDISAYCPGFPASIIRVERDEKYIRSLAAALDTFTACLEESKAILVQRYGVNGKLIAPRRQPEGDFDLTDEDVDAILAMNREKAK
jgi:hypothetical protein